MPDFKTIEEYQDHIINMPLQDIPEVFGLHSNADISYQVFNHFFLKIGIGRKVWFGNRDILRLLLWTLRETRPE